VHGLEVQTHEVPASSIGYYVIKLSKSIYSFEVIIPYSVTMSRNTFEACFK
jgi:hypothetical protein